jgi:hypothetical protein
MLNFIPDSWNEKFERTNMLSLKGKRQRLTRLVVASLLIFASVVPILMQSQLVEAAQVTSRFVELSSSAASATDVTYSVSFKAGSNHTVRGIVVQFCGNSPLVNTACTAPVGFNINKATLALANQSGISGFAVDTTNSTANTLIITNAGGSALTGGTTVVAFDMGSTGGADGVTNPTPTNQTFYARIVTYTTTAGAQGYVDSAVDTGGVHSDDGGVALSTANTITITAKVQETLTFCVYTGINCAAGGTAVALGDANGVLANTALVYTDASSKFDLATNASTGAVVRMKGDTLKTSGGTFSIDPYGTTCAADSTATNIEQFGVRISVSGAPLEPTVQYGCASGNHVLDVTGANNVTTTYGQAIADTTNQALDVATGTMEFAAKSALTTEAGIYTTTMIFIATATY